MGGSSQPLIAHTADKGGNALQGSAVTFTVTDDGGTGTTFTDGECSVDAYADAYGNASSPVLKTGHTPGLVTIVAVAGNAELIFYTLSVTSSV
ncbi:hypothetical protein ACR820_05330 [Streptomyces netropsis]